MALTCPKRSSSRPAGQPRPSLGALTAGAWHRPDVALALEPLNVGQHERAAVAKVLQIGPRPPGAMCWSPACGARSRSSRTNNARPWHAFPHFGYAITEPDPRARRQRDYPLPTPAIPRASETGSSRAAITSRRFPSTTRCLGDPVEGDCPGTFGRRRHRPLRLHDARREAPGPGPDRKAFPAQPPPDRQRWPRDSVASHRRRSQAPRPHGPRARSPAYPRPSTHAAGPYPLCPFPCPPCPHGHPSAPIPITPTPHLAARAGGTWPVIEPSVCSGKAKETETGPVVTIWHAANAKHLPRGRRGSMRSGMISRPGRCTVLPMPVSKVRVGDPLRAEVAHFRLARPVMSTT